MKRVGLKLRKAAPIQNIMLAKLNIPYAGKKPVGRDGKKTRGKGNPGAFSTLS